MAENNSCDVVIAHFKLWLVVEDTFGNDTALPDGNWGQTDLIGDITNCINAWNVGILEFINLDSSFLDLNSSILQIERLN